MKSQLDLIEERITTLNNIIGDIDIDISVSDISSKGKLSSHSQTTKEKFKNLCDAISYLQKQVAENETIHFKETNEIFETLSPLLENDKLKNDSNLGDKEMYFLLMSNFDEIRAFLEKVKYIKKNQKYLELNPIVDAEEKINAIKPLELQSMNLEAKVSKMNDNVDNLLKNYNETIDIINKKFALYNQLLGS